MKVTVKKWGNCAAVRLPAAVLSDADLAIDQTVDVRVDRGRVVLTPVKKRPSLSQLLDATPNFEGVAGWNDMPSLGREREAFSR